MTKISQILICKGFTRHCALNALGRPISVDPKTCSTLEEFPRMKETMRRPLPIEVLPYLRDHRAGGKTVLPAVEALQRLASSTQGYFPGIYILAMYHASFPRFLLIEPEDHIVEAYNEIETDDDGNLKVKLVTVSVSKRMKIARSRAYAQVCFKKNAPDLPGKNILFSLEDQGTFDISGEKLYENLVPLGPSYQNAYEPIRIFRTAGCIRTFKSTDASCSH